MKSFAICALLAVGASAIPMAAPNHAHLHHKRDVVYVTETDVDIVTERVTKTVWVDANGNLANHHHKSTTDEVQSATVAPQPESSTTTEASAPVAPETTSSTSVYVAPTTTSVYVAPTITSAYVAPTTTSVYVAPTTTPVYVAPTTTSVYVAPTSEAPAPASTSAAATSASSGGSGGGSGSLTYYAVGLGSCGYTNTDDEDVVALAADMMDKATDCGRSISITWNGITNNAKIVDTCPGCQGSGGLDLSPSLFVKFAPTASGVLPGATWSFN